MHLILLIALWGKYYCYLSLLFGGGNWGHLRLTPFPRSHNWYVVVAQLPEFVQINSLPFLTSVLYHRGLHFPGSLALWLPGWFSPKGSSNGSLERGRRRENRVFLPISLSLLPGVSLATAMSPTYICSTVSHSVVPVSIRESPCPSRCHHMAPSLCSSNITPPPVVPPVE